MTEAKGLGQSLKEVRRPPRQRQPHLRAELFRGECERAGDFLGEDFGIAEAKRVERDLGYHGKVGDHHGHRPKQGLQVVGQLRAAGVAGIHGDEDGAGGDQRDLRALENKAFRLQTQNGHIVCG